MNAEEAIANLFKRYVRLQLADASVASAPEHYLPLKEILSADLLARVGGHLEAGESDPLLGVQDLPEEWADRVNVVVQDERADGACAVVLLGPPPEGLKIFRVDALRDRHGRWRMHHIVEQG